MLSHEELETLPSGIDIHVHFREPGFVQKETMASGMKAAHAGGITSVIDMPNTYPPTDSILHLQQKLTLAKKFPGLLLAGGLTDRSVSNQELRKMCNLTPILKAFLAESTGNLRITESNFLKGIQQISSPALIMIHAEDPQLIQPRKKNSKELEVRPIEAEISSIKFVLEIANDHPDLTFHVTHVSSLDGAKLLERQDLVSWDVLAKYLCFTTEIVDDLGNFAKMNPPLRTKRDVVGLNELFRKNKIPILASDHAPHTIDEKLSEGVIAGAPGVQETYLFLIDKYVTGEIKKEVVIDVIHNNPVELLESVGITPVVGEVQIDKSRVWNFSEENIQSKCGWSLWKDAKFHGKIVKLVKP
ncbi:MAG: amidohydrolase family protein [Candidatus Kariarchaeaceae archaeon]